MRFVIDAQLPPGLANWLREIGHEALHVREVGLAVATDTEIWRYACNQTATLVTKDQDFIGLAESPPEGSAVLLIRLGNTTNRALLGHLEPLMPELLAALAGGEKIVEIR